MRTLLYILFLLFTFYPVVQAQKQLVYEDTASLQKNESVTADTALYINELQLPFDSVKNWRNLKEYAYMLYLDSLLKKEKEKQAPILPRTGGGGLLNNFLGSKFISAVLWTLAVFFIGFIIYRLFLAEGVFKRSSKTAVTEQPLAEETLITRESDFDALIRQALQTGQYRQAVRYHYLHTLHLLADKNMVELAPDKTNFQYVTEIANRSLQQDFAALTLSYAYVWYGEFNIEKNTYQKIETGFISIKQKLQVIN